MPEPGHETYMRRALELATLGQGQVSPNPMVGCVIVHEGRIIGEGWHRKFGEAHAEVNAVNAVADKDLLRQSTVYVTLEPCSHFGKTPPCADMLISHGIRKVVICNVDTNPLVGGKGVAKLKAAGIEVVEGVLEQEGRMLNRRFFTFIEKKRPYIILKWAQTQDGFIAREDYDSKWISNEYSRILVHKSRAVEDAVMVGSNTALHDNPRLNVRDWTGRNPLRVVLDRSGSLPESLNLFDKQQPTICYNSTREDVNENLEYIKISDTDFIGGAVKNLYQKKIQSVIVEGGTQVLSYFIQSNLWDEAMVFEAPKNFGKGISAPVINGNPDRTIKIEDDQLKIYFNK
jgi:diaminohydroxyphosphoribosylaminopyrimidine deaminase / 5-amino-6-(5-phosphoribosylamino)uracil reductase